jgi:hypothetical protein
MKAVAVYELLMLTGPDAPTPPQVLVLKSSPHFHVDSQRPGA